MQCIIPHFTVNYQRSIFWNETEYLINHNDETLISLRHIFRSNAEIIVINFCLFSALVAAARQSTREYYNTFLFFISYCVLCVCLQAQDGRREKLLSTSIIIVCCVKWPISPGAGSLPPQSLAGDIPPPRYFHNTYNLRKLPAQFVSFPHIIYQSALLCEQHHTKKTFTWGKKRVTYMLGWMDAPPPRQMWTGLYPLRVRVGGAEHHIITSLGTEWASALLAALSGSQRASVDWALLSRSGRRTPLHPGSCTGWRCLRANSRQSRSILYCDCQGCVLFFRQWCIVCTQSIQDVWHSYLLPAHTPEP